MLQNHTPKKIVWSWLVSQNHTPKKNQHECGWYQRTTHLKYKMNRLVPQNHTPKLQSEHGWCYRTTHLKKISMSVVGATEPQAEDKRMNVASAREPHT